MQAPHPVSWPMVGRRLDSGLTVIVAPDEASPGVAVNLWYRVGSADETAGRTGFAHLFEHLMFQGSDNVASGEHFALLERAGGIANATTSFDRTNYFATVPRGALELALWLEAERMSSLAVTQANFDAQREVVKEEKRQSYDNQPYGNLLEVLLGQHYPAAHPYAHTTIGSMADLDAATLADVQAFFDTWYRPNNAVLTIAGGLTASEGHELAQRYFGGIAAGPSVPVRAFDPAHLTPNRADVSGPVPHDVLYLSWASPSYADADAEPFDLLLALLADGMSSRLHRTIVKDLQLAESVGASGLTMSHTSSVAAISARLDDDQSLDAAEEAIVDVLDTLTSRPPSEDEIDRLRAQLERHYLSAMAGVESRADQISAAATHLGDPTRVNGYLDRIAALRADDLVELAERYLAPADRFVLRYHKEN